MCFFTDICSIVKMALGYLKNWRKVNSMVKKLAEDDREEDMSNLDDDETDAVDDGRDQERSIF